MKKLIIMVLGCYCSVAFAIKNRDIPHVFVDPQGDVVNYADLYRTGDEVVIQYYFDSSVARLAVHDGQNSYALYPIIRTELREGLLQWANAVGHQFRLVEVNRADRANLVIYGLTNWMLSMDPPPMMAIPLNMPSPSELPRVSSAGSIYIVNNGLQSQLDTFLDSDQIFSRRFRTYTGINNVRDYLTYTLFLALIHESGHALGLTHPGGERGMLGGYTIRPIAERIPSSITPGTQIMLADILDYLEGRYQQLGHPVQRDDITISNQESWLMRYLWSERNRVLHCLPPSQPSARIVSASSPPRGCMTFLPSSGVLSWLWVLL